MLAPQTPLGDRLAAASQGHRLFTVAWVPRVLEVIKLLEREEELHGWGFESEIGWRALPAERERHVLGASWTLPQRFAQYPRTWAEEQRAPWPWQVSRATHALFNKMYPVHREPNTAPVSPRICRAWLDRALALPHETDQDASWFVNASGPVSECSDFRVFARWRAIALDPSHPRAAATVALAIENLFRFGGDPDAVPMAQLLLVDFLRLSPHEDLRRRLASGLINFRERVRDRKVLPAEPCYAAVLAVAEAALDERRGDAQARLYFYVPGVAWGLDTRKLDPLQGRRVGSFETGAGWNQAPLDPELLRDIDSLQKDALLARFTAWFAHNRPTLVRAAAREEAALAPLRRRLAQAPR
jgi:hypothetical protein